MGKEDETDAGKREILLSAEIFFFSSIHASQDGFSMFSVVCKHCGR